MGPYRKLDVVTFFGPGIKKIKGEGGKEGEKREKAGGGGGGGREKLV